ncbi:hypothetical protein KQX54_006679, partial [Cotesia glomerata]
MMGKVCAIKNCDSGRKSLGSKKNMPFLSFFQATETSQRLEKWTECLESPQQLEVPINVNSQPIQVHFNDNEEYQQPQQQKILNIRDKGMQQVFVEQRGCNDSIDSQKSIRDFIDQMKNVTILPEFWSFSNKPNGLEFMRVDPETKQIKYHIRINHDLSIT